MSNLKKYAFAAVILTVAGGVYINNLHRNIPADLRDAVASEGAAGQLQESAPQSTASEIPAPKAAAVEFKLDDAARGGVMIKGFRVKSGLNRFSKSAHKGNLKAASASLSGLARMQEETGVEGATPYEVLKNLYAKGEPATEKDLTGWYSGRMVKDNTPNEFGVALIVGKRYPVSPGGGPLFDGKMEFRMGSFMASEDVATSHYDTLTKETISNVEEALHRNESAVISFPEAKGELPNGGKVQYRKIKGYIFEYFSVVDPKTGKPGEVYSYFYLNVTPKSQGGPLFQ